MSTTQFLIVYSDQLAEKTGAEVKPVPESGAVSGNPAVGDALPQG